MRNGILNIYKEKGYTSHDVVARLRRITGQRKIGHTGTLDPDAEGVLPVCLGKATRVCGMLTDHDKVYEAVLLLGVTTDTQDISGTVLSRQDTRHITAEDAESCILGFVGEYDQIPPMYSALKVNGRKLYELAREGRTVERKSRRVKILSIRILEWDLPRIRIQVACSKGTYIRTLCQDIGDRLGTGGCMESLLRTEVGRFHIRDSLRLDQVARFQEEGRMGEILLPVDQVFSLLPGVTVKESCTAIACNGNPLKADQLTDGSLCAPGGRCRLYSGQGQFIGVYGRSMDGRYVPEKMFYDPEEQASDR